MGSPSGLLEPAAHMPHAEPAGQEVWRGAHQGRCAGEVNILAKPHTGTVQVFQGPLTESGQ